LKACAQTLSNPERAASRILRASASVTRPAEESLGVPVSFTLRSQFFWKATSAGFSSTFL